MKTFSQDLPEIVSNEDARPAHPVVKALADAAVLLMQANADLEIGKRRVPDYVPYGSVESYYAFEQDAFNRAAEAYADAVVAVTREASE